jgi:hypothetical protein
MNSYLKRIADSSGRCYKCSTTYNPGDEIFYHRIVGRSVCLRCNAKDIDPSMSEPIDRMSFNELSFEQSGAE